MTSASRDFGTDWSEFVRVFSPYPVHKKIATGQNIYWLAAKIECRKCDKSWEQRLRIHRVQLDMVTGIANIKPYLTDLKVATSFMVHAVNNSVGCWKSCRPWTHPKVCQRPAVKYVLGHNPMECRCPNDAEQGCTCPKGCGNQGIYPCQCGWVKIHHRTADCPFALYKRHSDFAADFMRSQLITGKMPW